MYIHNLNPIIFDFGILSLRWYSLAYILGIVFGWWYGKKIILFINNRNNKNYNFGLNITNDETFNTRISADIKYLFDNGEKKGKE